MWVVAGFQAHSFYLAVGGALKVIFTCIHIIFIYCYWGVYYI